jgi:hypothetical protein
MLADMSYDILEEQRRLQQQYAFLTEDELQAVADDAYDLTDLARETLQSEIRARGQKIKLRDAPAPPESEPAPVNEATEDGEFDPEDLDLVSITLVHNLPEARRVMDVLHAASIPCYLGHTYVDDADAFRGNFADGVELRIRAQDRENTRRVLAEAQPFDKEGDAPDPGDYIAGCPRCHSPDIIFQGRDAIPPGKSGREAKFNWTCDACGHTWKDDGVEAVG